MKNQNSPFYKSEEEIKADEAKFEENTRKILEFRERLHDPEFQRKFDEKQRRGRCLLCLIRIFCCPCIVLNNLTKI